MKCHIFELLMKELVNALMMREQCNLSSYKRKADRSFRDIRLKKTLSYPLQTTRTVFLLLNSNYLNVGLKDLTAIKSHT